MKPCRIAFYAPMKAPDHPVPSGDRRIGRLLMDALAMIPGVRVDLACRFRSRDSTGQKAARVQALGARCAEALLRRYNAHPETKPNLWLTYHLYYKAPDWIGPQVASALKIPYVVAEASLSSKRMHGVFAPASAAVARALQGAALSLSFNPVDAETLARFVPGLRQEPLAPFLDLTPYRAAADERLAARADLAARYDLPLETPWLLAVGMMRAGDKAASFRLLAEALVPLQDRPWSLLLVGNGPMRADLATAFAPFGDRVRWLGALPENSLPSVYAACDWLVWPAINEAIGMALLEAQAAGLPVIAGAAGAIPTLIADGETGFLAPVGDRAAFTERVGAALVTAPEPFRVAALVRTAARHGLPAASAHLAELLTDLGVR
jgi:glycosyltransferase involved in cell wall biosynthesis